MKKKIVIISILIVLSILIISLFLFKREGEVNTGEITLVIDNSRGDINSFNQTLLNLYSYQNDVIKQIVTSTEDNYLEFMGRGLSTEGVEDLYYTVFSSQVFDTALKADYTNSYNSDFSTDLPSIFYSFSNNRNSYFYIPITWSPWGIYYNKKVFKELNLIEPKTLDELNDICNKLLINNITPYSMIQKVKWPLTAWFDYLNLRRNGVDFHNQLLAGLIEFTDPRVFEIYLEIYHMISDGYFNIDDTEYEWKSMISSLEQENTAMVLGGTFYYENASEDFKDNMGWFSFPIIVEGDNYSEVVSSSGYIINGSSENIEGVNDFIRYTLSYSGQRVIKEYTEYYPVNSELLSTYGRDDLNKGYENVLEAKKLIASFERNNSSKIHLQFKSSLNILFKIKGPNDITQLLLNLEKSRINTNNN